MLLLGLEGLGLLVLLVQFDRLCDLLLLNWVDPNANYAASTVLRLIAILAVVPLNRRQFLLH